MDKFTALQRICIFALAFVACFKPTSALVCYSCNSEYDPRCDDPFDSYSLGKVNCSMTSPLDHLPKLETQLCRKTKQKVYGKIRVVRGCGYLTDDRDDKECVRRLGTHDVSANYCACTTDLCNKAQPTHNQMTLPIVLGALFIYFSS